MNPETCLCGHSASDHDMSGIATQPCRDVLHPACGCLWFRLDYRSRIEPEPGESAATGGEAG